MSDALVRYDAMCHAITAAFKIDEVKSIRDKARALEIYAKQARNIEAERKACEIRLRAERKTGQLLRQVEKAKRGPAQTTGQGSQRATSEAAKTLSELGISKTQSARWQKMAAIPDPAFEATLTQAALPTTAGLIEAAQLTARPQIIIDDRAVWLWGRLLDFERLGLLDVDPNTLVESMIEHMHETIDALAPRVIAWLGRIKHDR